MNNKMILGMVVLLTIISGCNNSGSNDADKLFAKGEYQLAIDAYNSYLASNSTDVKTLYNRGRAYQELDKLEEAEADFMAVIKIDDTNQSAKMSLSKLYYSKKLYNKAVLWADQAVEINSNSAQAHFLAARARHQLGYVDSAFKSYTSAIKIDPDFGEAYLYRGALKVHQGKTSGACEDFNKAKALKVSEAQSIINKYCK